MELADKGRFWTKEIAGATSRWEDCALLARRLEGLDSNSAG
jgi:hypothetical protein